MRASRTTRRSPTCAPSVYTPGREHGVHPLDPALGLGWPPTASQPLLSPKDAAAPTLAQARERGCCRGTTTAWPCERSSRPALSALRADLAARSERPAGGQEPLVEIFSISAVVETEGVRVR